MRRARASPTKWATSSPSRRRTSAASSTACATQTTASPGRLVPGRSCATSPNAGSSDTRAVVMPRSQSAKHTAQIPPREGRASRAYRRDRGGAEARCLASSIEVFAPPGRALTRPSPPSPRGEGLASGCLERFLQGVPDGLDDAVEIAVDIGVPEPDRAETPVGQAPLPLAIGCGLTGERMLPAVDVDDELPTQADEVHDGTASRRLPAKVVALRAQLAQTNPELHLVRRHASAQGPCSLVRHRSLSKRKA